jgi:DNA primase
LAQWGFENAVATLGTAVTPMHVQRLFRQTDRVVFSFDGDTAGRKAAWRALEASLPHASEERRIEFIFLSAEHDPDSYIREFGADAFELQVSGAVPLSQFLIKEVAARHSLNDVEGRAAAVSMLRPLVQQIPPSAYRVALVRALSEPLQSTPAELEQQFGLRKKNGQAMQYTPAQKKERVRPGAVDPEKRVAALLMLAPQLAVNCQEYAQQLEGNPNLSDSQRGLVALIFSMIRNSFPNVGSIMELFRNSTHSHWVGSVIYDSVQLDSDIEPESEVAAAMAQCWDRWIAQELERLVSTGLKDSDTQESYRYWSRKRILLKQDRINSI